MWSRWAASCRGTVSVAGRSTRSLGSMRASSALSEIQWHDAVLLRAIELAVEDALVFEVDYPEGALGELPNPHTIRFTDVTRYQIEEGPFSGAPTILSVAILESRSEGRDTLRIETNAGHRIVECHAIELARGRYAA